MKNKKANIVLSSLIEAMKSNGFECTSPYDIKNFMADYAKSEILFPLIRKARVGTKINTPDGTGTIVGFRSQPDVFVVDLDAGGTTKIACDDE